MIVKPPIAEHIRKDMIFEIAGLLRKARLAPREGDGKDSGTGRAPSEDAIAGYRKALGLIAVFRNSATPKQLFELHDLLRDFPSGDFGAEGKEVCESLRDSLLEQYRRKVFAITGWASE
jgi:hypothetical protein